MNTAFNKTTSLVPRPPSALIKVEPGAKRVLAAMVSDTLALALRQSLSILASPTDAEVEKWFRLGEKFYFGQGVPQDYTEAVKWYRKAAEQGHANAQNGLGDCFYHGRGFTRDYTEAVKWYRKAAELDYAPAQGDLGMCYYNGEGVLEDYAEAVKWFRKAIDQGDAYAQYCLGFCYHYGNGVPQDYTEAVKCFRKAAEQGNAHQGYFICLTVALRPP